MQAMLFGYCPMVLRFQSGRTFTDRKDGETLGQGFGFSKVSNGLPGKVTLSKGFAGGSDGGAESNGFPGTGFCSGFSVESNGLPLGFV